VVVAAAVGAATPSLASASDLTIVKVEPMIAHYVMFDDLGRGRRSRPMMSYSRPLSPLAAAICVAAMTWAASPAVAAEGPVTAGETAVKASTVRPVMKRHASRRSHLAISRYNRRSSLIGASPVCSGDWCGRQFVLMVGIGF
jgi:hypothetical protein